MYSADANAEVTQMLFPRLAWATMLGLMAASAATAADHPCAQLANNSKLGEVWPDEFTSTMRELAAKPRGTFQKSADYELAERVRQTNVSARYPMFAVVSKAKWSDFAYDADSETLSMVAGSVHATTPCGQEAFCNQLIAWSNDAAGRLEHSRALPLMKFKVPPGELETVVQREEPILYFVVSPRYPYSSTSMGDRLVVDLHCAALVSDEDGSIRDEDDTLLHIWAPLESTLSSQGVDELFKPKGCGEADCRILRTTGWGSVRLGVQYAGIRAAVGGDVIDASNEFWCGVGGSAWPDGLSASLDARQKIDNIYVEEGSGIRAPEVKTEKGIGIGSTLAAMRKAYPTAKAQPEYDGGVDYIVPVGPSRVLLFRTGGGRVLMIGLGTNPAAERDGCPKFAAAR